MDYIGELKSKIRLLHGCEAQHKQTIRVFEAFHGETVWDGEVEIFDITGHPKAKRCYAWGYPNEKDPEKLDVVAVLEIPPVDSAETAVKAAIMATARVLVEKIVCAKCGKLQADVWRTSTGYDIESHDLYVKIDKGAFREDLAWAVCPKCGHETPFDASFLPKPKE